MKIGDRLAHAWNAFMNRDPTTNNIYSGSSYFNRPDRTRLRTGTEKSIINAIISSEPYICIWRLIMLAMALTNDSFGIGI